MIRWLAIAACALTICITASSAFIRHAQAGLGCPGWPNGECVAGLRAVQGGANAGTQAAARPALQEPGVRTARALHRASAMLVGVLVLLIAVFGWSSMRTGARVALAIALADTAFLAWLGRFTPHPLPLVTIANLVGGIALAAAFAWIAAARRSPAYRGAAGKVSSQGFDSPTGAAPTLLAPVVVALALLAAAAWIGTMIGAHDAIGACEGARCAGSVRLDASALDPLRTPASIDAPAARAMHWLHRLVAAAFVAAVLVVAVRSRRQGASRVALLLVVLLVAQIAAGIDTTIGVSPLATATLHNALATLLAVVLAAIAARSQGAASLTGSGLAVGRSRA
ncbi:MAG: COX15/CtaA family protein [Burkholderiaceae bacterium]|nr:COX15/CtaA family protein [Burkholderiaceae bacterium]